MNRLWVRLTLAFVAVTTIGVATIALLTDWSAGQEFRQFLAQQDIAAQSALLDNLAAFYEQSGSWTGVGQVLSAQPFAAGPGRGQGAMRGRPGLALADASGRVVYDERSTRTGTTLSPDERAAAIPIQVSGGRIVGYLLATGGPGRGVMQQSEQAFLDELRRTLIVGGLVAGGIGIVMGLIISRMLTSPLSELAQAARAFAARDWNRRVRARGTEEIATVAREFNVMAEAIQRADAQRRHLMADVAHELRTPLTVLQGNLRALLDGVYPLELGEIATLYDETRLLNRLVDDLRELALADAGQLPLNLQDVVISDLCRSVTADFFALAEEQKIHLAYASTEGTGPCARADPDRVAQVLRNLMANALRHTPAGGSVMVAARTESNAARITVEDTGEGIAADDLPHVFDRFYRGDKSRERDGGGTGLGLAIAKAWVEAMGGTIGVESVPGQGSRFWFTLPAGRDVACNVST